MITLMIAAVAAMALTAGMMLPASATSFVSLLATRRMSFLLKTELRFQDCMQISKKTNWLKYLIILSFCIKNTL